MATTKCIRQKSLIACTKSKGRFCTLQEVGRAMINAAENGYARQILEVEDIAKLAKAKEIPPPQCFSSEK
jgi:hypothetical protein